MGEAVRFAAIDHGGARVPSGEISSYESLNRKFLYQQLPLSAPRSERFEVASAAVFGTKQRRLGPMPSPETQVAVRDVLRASGNEVSFFAPWGARKQSPGQGLDVLELMALRQLQCLQRELRDVGVAARFYFRVENLTDRWLFSDDRSAPAQIADYVAQFKRLATHLLGDDTVADLESAHASWSSFAERADVVTDIFYGVLSGRSPESSLADMGWRGGLPREQVEHYLSAYAALWPSGERDLLHEVSKFFAGVVARAHVGAQALPPGPHVTLSFTHPVPGGPAAGARLHYRSIPQRFTNTHRPPWIGRGYLQISEGDVVTPRSAGHLEKLDYQRSVVRIGDAVVEADYVLA